MSNLESLPTIPEKRYFTIGEVGRLCVLKPHVLRYWEQEFDQLKPTKRRGNRRYYRHQDVLLVRRIRNLLYEEGYTIEGARGQLAREAGPNPLLHITHREREDCIHHLESALKILSDA